MPKTSPYHNNPSISRLFKRQDDSHESHLTVLLDYYLQYLPTVKVYTKRSERPRLYQPGRKKLLEWLIQNQSQFITSFESPEVIRELYDLMYKPIKYKHIQFFLLGGGYKSTYWGVYNGMEHDTSMESIQIQKEGYDIHTEVLKSKGFVFYKEHASIKIDDETQITFSHNPGVFASLLADPIGVDYKGNIIYEHKDIDLIDSEGRRELNEVVNYGCHFEQLIEHTSPHSSQYQSIENKTITFTIGIGAFQEYMFINRIKPYRAKTFISSTIYAIEQLINDSFASRNDNRFKLRRTIRLGSKLIFGIDVYSSNHQYICEKINEFIQRSRELFRALTLAKSMISKGTNPYFKNLIRSTRKIKVGAKDKLYLFFVLSILPQESQQLISPYQYRVDLGRQPDIEVLPNTASLAINDVIFKELFTQQVDMKSNVFVDERSLLLIRPENTKAMKIQTTHPAEKGRAKDIQVAFYCFSDTIR